MNKEKDASKVPFYKDKNKLLTTVVVVFLCLMFVVGFAIGLDKVLAMEGTDVPVVDPAAVTAPETVEADPIAYLNGVVDKAVTAGEASLVKSDSFEINEDAENGRELKIEGSDTVSSVFDYIKDNVLGKLSENTEDETVDYAGDISALLKVPNITAADFDETGFENKYVYYSCYSCGETSEEYLDRCDKCGSDRAYDERFYDEYTLTYNLTENALGTNFNPRTPEEVKALLGDELNNIADVKIENISYDGLQLVAAVNRETDHLNRLEYVKNTTVTAVLTFKGEYSALGTVTMTVPVCEKVIYSFSWPSLVLSADEMVIEPGSSDNLLATLTCDDPIQYTGSVKWSISDESVATVDEEGYIKALKQKENVYREATVTASFEYKGKTYSDTCLVKVLVPVESSKMSKSKLTLGTGEKFTLEAKLSPAKATVKDVKWESLDESVVTVDANGVVTAVAPGTAVVRSVSVDGYYISTCEVTVR